MSDYKINVYMPIEVKTRELSAKVLIALQLLNFNMRVYIGSKISVNSLIFNKKEKGGIYLYAGGLDFATLQSVKNKCDYFVILDEEFGPAISDWDRIGERISFKTLSMIDGLFVIGYFAHIAAKKQYPSISSKIIKTGWPRVDLWSDKYKALYFDKVNAINNKHGKFILFSSDFGVLTNERALETKRFLLNSHDYEKTVNLAEKETEKSIIARREFKELVALFEKIDKHLKIKIIIRPHPVEEINIWRKSISNLKNVHVLYEGDATEWILASSGVIHRGCTSAVHAYSVNTKVGFINVGDKFLARKDALPFKLSESIKGESQLIEFCNRNSTRCEILEEHKECYKNTIHIDSEKESSFIIANYMYKNFKRANVSRVSSVSRILSSKVWMKINYTYLKSKISLFFYPNKYATTPISRKIPGGIGLSEMKRTICCLSDIKNVSVTKVMKDLFEIDLK